SQVNAFGGAAATFVASPLGLDVPPPHPAESTIATPVSQSARNRVRPICWSSTRARAALVMRSQSAFPNLVLSSAMSPIFLITFIGTSLHGRVSSAAPEHPVRLKYSAPSMAQRAHWSNDGQAEALNVRNSAWLWLLVIGTNVVR